MQKTQQVDDGDLVVYLQLLVILVLLGNTFFFYKFLNIT